MEKQSKLLLVFVTVPNEEVAKAIANALVELRLAACVNIIPGLRSVYRWEGKVCEDGELLLKIKTSSKKYQALEDKVIELHPYQNVEVVAVESCASAKKYSDWVFNETKDESV